MRPYFLFLSFFFSDLSFFLFLLASWRLKPRIYAREERIFVNANTAQIIHNVFLQSTVSLPTKAGDNRMLIYTESVSCGVRTVNKTDSRQLAVLTYVTTY